MRLVAGHDLTTTIGERGEALVLSHFISAEVFGNAISFFLMLTSLQVVAGKAQYCPGKP